MKISAITVIVGQDNTFSVPGNVLLDEGAEVSVGRENPSYLMNSALDTVNSVAGALLGRVPCQVVGPIDRGDLLNTSEIKHGWHRHILSGI